MTTHSAKRMVTPGKKSGTHNRFPGQNWGIRPPEDQLIKSCDRALLFLGIGMISVLALCLLSAKETPERRAKRLLDGVFTHTLRHMVDTYKEPVGCEDVNRAWSEYQVGCTSNTTDDRKKDLASKLIAAVVRRMDIINRSDK